jgi:hypothetical protein
MEQTIGVVRKRLQTKGIDQILLHAGAHRPYLRRPAPLSGLRFYTSPIPVAP